MFKCVNKVLLKNKELYLRVKISEGANCQFGFSSDGRNFQNLGGVFKAREGRRIGAKVGFFFTRPGKLNDAGTVEVNWFRFEK